MDDDHAKAVAQAVANIYSDAEVHLLRRIANAMSKGIDSPAWASLQLGEVNRLAELARGDLFTIDATLQSQILAALTDATAAGEAAAVQQALAAGGPATTPAAAVNVAAVEALAAETVAVVAATHPTILRSVQDVYRSTVAEVTGRMVTGTATRREVTQQVLNRFAQRGITSFVDKAGRKWKPDTYAEMATRTAAIKAQRQGHADKLGALGYDLVVINNHANPAPECQPFEGKVLSLSGRQRGRIYAENRLTGGRTHVDVKWSIREAEARGLFHPNCGHRYTLWVPGASIPKPAKYDGPEGYQNTQKLRYLERQVRAAKRVEAVAMNDDERAKARAVIRHRQAAIRDHVTTTNTPRLRHREQLRTGNGSNALPTVRVNDAPTPTGGPRPTGSPNPRGPVSVVV